jgi:hypothetical protein
MPVALHQVEAEHATIEGDSAILSLPPSVERVRYSRPDELDADWARWVWVKET